MSKKQKSDPIVQPLVKDAHSPHPFELMELEGTLPVLTSVGFCRLGTTSKFVTYVIKSQGSKVLSIECGDPDSRGIAEETSKIDFVTHLIDTEHAAAVFPTEKAEEVVTSEVH
jgi:hypothetical protein